MSCIGKAIPNICCRNTTLDVEPIYTLRGHRTQVLSMAINQAGSQLFSGSLDGTIRTWNLPSLAIDPYDPFGARAPIRSSPLTSPSHSTPL